MLTPVNKTSKMQKLTKNKYNNILDKATHKKATKWIEDIINEKGNKYEKQAEIFDRIEINSTSSYFIPL